MHYKNRKIDIDFDIEDDQGGVVWDIDGSISKSIPPHYKSIIDQYLDRIVQWVRLALFQNNVGRVLNYQKITTSRYIFDVFSGKNPQFNDRYVWYGKMFSYQEFFYIEQRFNLIWYQALESHIENIIKSSIDFRL